MTDGPGHGLKPGRLRVWATRETCDWLRWLKDYTGRTSSRSVESAVELLVLVESERAAGNTVAIIRTDGTVSPLVLK